jgi:hypothetical protein
VKTGTLHLLVGVGGVLAFLGTGVAQPRETGELT